MDAPQNYIVRPPGFLEPIPDHAITSPFGSSPQHTVSEARFQKYRHHIVPWYRALYDKFLYSTSGFKCEVCGAKLNNTKSTLILCHLASLKHLKAAGVLETTGKLESCDKDNRRWVYKQSADANVSNVDGVVADVARPA